MNRTNALVLGLALLFSSVTASNATVGLPHIFTDHMVLQRQMPVPVWGTAAPGEQVSVSFAGQTKTATATADGHWRVTLDPLEASSTPREMTITGSNSLKFEDVVVGEVWLCSGQSNMGKPVGTWRGMNPTPNYEQEPNFFSKDALPAMPFRTDNPFSTPPLPIDNVLP